MERIIQWILEVITLALNVFACNYTMRILLYTFTVDNSVEKKNIAIQRLIKTIVFYCVIISLYNALRPNV